MRDAKVDEYMRLIVNTQLRTKSSPLVNDALERIGRTALMAYAQPLQLLALRR